MPEAQSDRVPITIKVNPKIKTQFKKALDQDGRKATGLITKWIREYTSEVLERGSRIRTPDPLKE